MKFKVLFLGFSKSASVNLKRMKIILWTSCLVLTFLVHSNGQINCDDYDIVSVYDIPPSPQTPGGNYFLLLLTLREDHLGNFDNYANLFFLDQSGDTVSIPTGTNQTLPRYSTDTIPYILELNSTSSNQDFPTDFDGKLVIVHITQLICEVDYSNVSTTSQRFPEELQAKVYPNPANSYVRIDPENYPSDFTVHIKNQMGQIVQTSKNEHIIQLDDLSPGMYLLTVQSRIGAMTKKLMVQH